MSAAEARRIALRVHADQLDGSGEPVLMHIRRVAAAVTPRSARTVAWLHDLLELSAAVPHEALAELSAAQRTALELLTRTPSESDERYLRHVARIASAPGSAGKIARAVKLADLEDRVVHPVVRPSGWAPPYATALELVRAACGRSAQAVDLTSAASFRAAGA